MPEFAIDCRQGIALRHHDLIGGEKIRRRQTAGTSRTPRGLVMRFYRRVRGVRRFSMVFGAGQFG